MIIYIIIRNSRVVKMSESRELLAEAERANKLLVCISSLIYQGLGSNYPGLNALFLLRLRLLGIDPQVGLTEDVESYIRTLVSLVGGEKMAEQLLRSVLPKKRVFDEILKSLLSSHSRSELETSLLGIVGKYERDLRSVCRNVY